MHPNCCETLQGIFPPDFKASAVPTGSRHLCEPSILDTDDDYLVWSSLEPSKYLIDAGFVNESITNPSGSSRPTDLDGNPDWRFSSWRRGNLNLIVTQSEEFAKKHAAASHVCKKLNLQKKWQRIMIFQAVLYGNQHESINEPA